MLSLFLSSVGPASYHTLDRRSELPAIYDAGKYMRSVSSSDHGQLFHIEAPGGVHLDVLRTQGSAYERGVAHGRLQAGRIAWLLAAMPDFYRSQVAGLLAELPQLPQWLQQAIHAALPVIEAGAPAAFALALDWIEGQQRAYNNQSAVLFYDELAGIAAGTCEVIECDQEKTRVELVLAPLPPPSSSLDPTRGMTLPHSRCSPDLILHDPRPRYPPQPTASCPASPLPAPPTFTTPLPHTA